MTVLVEPFVDWYCPNCGKRDQTREVRPHVRLHPCPSLHLISAPMLRADVKAKVTAIERQDYVGREIVTYDDERRPIMSVVTEREDGTDALVFAGHATLRADGH